MKLRVFQVLMDGLTTVRSGEEPYMQFDKLKLRNYFPHEIEKLSVLRVTQTRSFDEVGAAQFEGVLHSFVWGVSSFGSPNYYTSSF